jgi:hypothetical protein
MHTRRIAWDRLTFRIPGNWEVSRYRFLRKGVARLEFEDEYTCRMEMEWIRPRQRVDMKTVLERYTKAAKQLTLKAIENQRIDGLPRGWTGTRFIFKETSANANKGIDVAVHELVTAFYLAPESGLFCFLLIHLLPEDPEDPGEVLRTAAANFEEQSADTPVQWELFDIAFKLPAAFTLERSLFDVGAKLMVFGWKWRRLHLWHFSCADMILTDGRTKEEWIAGYLNSYSGLKGPVFYPGPNGRITWRRRSPWIFGHRREWSRGCMRYEVRCREDTEKNQLIAWVYHYRRATDLDMIPEKL